ncbi:MAG: CHAT domain-containing protein [Phormidesmis sp.]
MSMVAWMPFSLLGLALSAPLQSATVQPLNAAIQARLAQNNVQESLTQDNNQGSVSSEIPLLLEAGNQAYEEGDTVAAARYYQRVIALIEKQEAAEQTVDLNQKGEALYWLSVVHFYDQDYEAAHPLLEAVLALYETISVEDERAYADIRMHVNYMLSAIAKSTGGYATALAYTQSALSLAQANNRPEAAAGFHHDIGVLEADIGRYENAQTSLKEAIALSSQFGIQGLEGSAAAIMGWMQEQQENLETAAIYYQRAIALFSDLRHQGISEQQSEAQLNNIVSREIRTHNNLGIVRLKQGNTVASRQSLDQGIKLLSQQDSLVERALLLDSMGSLLKAEGEIEQAWSHYLQAWQLSHRNSDNTGEIALWLNLGGLMETQQEPELAIFFYKQAIAQIERTRTDLRKLSQAVQQRYTDSVESAYRTLADLLIQQGREAEALQVLELLKLQEIKAYLHNEREGRTAGAQQFNTPAEADLLQVFTTLPVETSLAEFIAHPAVILLKHPAGTNQTQQETFSLQAVEALKKAISQQPTNTVALYPLILEDHLEILLLTPTGTVEQFTTQVSQTQLQTTINELQRALQNKAIDAKPAAQQLHRWLIQPLSEVLTTQQIDNIIYLPDGVLRYVPLAAFHDGRHWLVENYQSHTITAATIDDLTADHKMPPGVMAGAFTDSTVVHRVDVGTRSFAYTGLSAAQQEVDNLLQALPNSDVLLNQDFNPDSLLKGVGDRPILHLATHAQFLPGEPEDSFILFGDGRTVTLRGLQQWQLPNVDLVVLSACQTASSTDGDGKEILGLGYQIQATGAKAAIASLWSVDDTATAALMSQFYKHLSTGKTKAAALHAAQTDLIKSQLFNNPYDWAAFILMGNGQ